MENNIELIFPFIFDCNQRIGTWSSVTKSESSSLCSLARECWLLDPFWWWSCDAEDSSILNAIEVGTLDLIKWEVHKEILE